MIKRWKIVECSWCGKKAPMERMSYLEDTWWDIPVDWAKIKISRGYAHFCPDCAKAICKAQIELETEENKE